MAPSISPRNYDNVCRTAIDALQAKYSAIIYAGYTPKQHSFKSQHDDDVTAVLVAALNYCIPVNKPWYDHLLQCVAEYYIPTPKRQVPLINAGYGIRVSTVLHQIESFVAFHRWNDVRRYNNNEHLPNIHPNPNHHQVEIQIIVLGCGFDVTGLWSLSLADQALSTLLTPISGSSSIGMHVVEIDFPSICSSKIHAIQSLKMLDHSPGNNDTTTVLNAWHGVDRRNANARYTILSADLQDQSIMEDIFTSLGVLDTNLPTLILSELVLTYVPQNSCNFILQRIATLFRHTGSCMVLYEPLGPTTNTETTEDAVISVLESYKRSYCNSFNSKLQRGVVNKSTKVMENETEYRDVPQQQHQPRFHPLGISTVEVRERLEQFGYDHVNVATAGTVASYLQKCTNTEWRALELFDEHAALALHLSSYVVVTAFPKAKRTDFVSNDVDGDTFRRYLCPWLFHGGLLLHPQPIGRLCMTNNHDSLNTDSSSIWITTIRKDDEKQVRDMFHQTYQYLFDEHPSIRKMVKAALRKDLGVGGIDSVTSLVANDNSLIGIGYYKQGGDFMVAIRTSPSLQNENNATMEASSDDRTNGHHIRQVLGGIGIRQCTREECVSRSIPSNDTICYEIHRFFVHNDYRGYGIGTALFQLMTQALVQRRKRLLRRYQQHTNAIPDSSTGTSAPLLYLTATTPTILLEANQFYQKHGFTIQSIVNIGELSMNTYVKAIYA